MSRSCNLLIVVLVLGAGAVSSLAQLSPADIAALRAQGEREGWTFVVTENPATARPLSALCGLAEPPNWQETAQFDPCEGVIDELPRIFDWRDVDGRNYCPPIRDQRSCGSCWAFASVGPVECAIKIKDDVFVDLSEQWLVSCNQSGWSCAGGWWSHDYYRGATDPCGGTGAVLEAAFPYVASNVPCRCPYPHVYRLIDWRYIGTGGGVPSVSSMKQAIYDRGPVCVAVYVDNAFQSYGGGVFNACANGTVNHGVVLVGWNDDDQCWLMRNSWGAGWGEDGYMRIKYNCSRIGYGATYVVYGSMQVNPQDGAELIGEPGGPFNPPSASYTLTNNSSVPFSYQVMKTQPWLTITNGAGTIPAGGAVQFSVSANSAANSLPLGVYEDTVTIQNMTNHNGDTTRRVYLRVGV
ncbi:MAG: C1 family peptidase, partial [Planctomycetota bacterium]